MTADKTGKLCYLEIPATDIRQSADFYARAFGWPLRHRGYQQPGLAEAEKG